jgi:threonine aldolase
MIQAASKPDQKSPANIIVKIMNRGILYHQNGWGNIVSPVKQAVFYGTGRKGMEGKRGFMSDNNSGIHPRILESIQRVNTGHRKAYGNDPETASAVDNFKRHFGEDIDVYFVFNGTGANVLGLKTVTESFHSIICSEASHLNEDECGAPEYFSGCKLETIKTEDGKISPGDISRFLHVFGDEHRSQPKAVSITQSTELGTVYKLNEIKVIAELAHENEMLLHMDGARISNAAVSLGLDFRAFTRDAGVDVLSFGGTKNGMMIGEAVIFFDIKYSKNFKYIRKQGMQLGSKMRYISAQFDEFLNQGLWHSNARRANDMAKLLARELEKIPCCMVTQKVEANAVFVSIPRRYLDEIFKEYFFYIWDESVPVVRLMTSFDTVEEDIAGLIAVIRKVVTG